MENTNNNPLLEINTSFSDYLEARTRNSTEHIVDGRMDYAFDGDFALRAKINTISGWSRLYKTIVAADMPGEFKKLFRSADTATSMVHAKAYSAAIKCSERLQVSLPVVIVKSVREMPEIYSLSGESFNKCIVLTSDIEDICTEQELYYLIGCEIGRIQNNHSAFKFAFTYPGINAGDSADTAPADGNSNMRQINYALNSWLKASDITADRAGIICLDKPESFPEIYVSVRNKAIPDSAGKTCTDIDLPAVLEQFDEVHKTPARALKLDPEMPWDERRIMAGLEFIGCEILYSWRQDLHSDAGTHLTNKQGLEIRCDLLAGSDEQANI